MSDLPAIKDFARLNPPYASVVPSRDPVVKWHATRGGARTSALYDTTKFDESDVLFQSRRVKLPCAIAKVAPNGDLVYVEWFKVGDVVS